MSPRLSMSLSTARNAGRLEWISEISAYRISVIGHGTPHYHGGLGAGAAELYGLSDGRRDFRAGRRLEAESRKIFLGRCSEQVKLFDAARSCPVEKLVHQLAADTTSANVARDD